MSFGRDNVGADLDINYEPSARAGLVEAAGDYREYRPTVASTQVLKASIERTNNYGQAGDRIRTMPDWERDDLALNLTTLLGDCDKHIQERMVAHFTKAEESFGKRLADGLGIDHGSLDIEALADVTRQD
jgi:catalase